MKKKESSYIPLSELSIPAFGYELIREDLLTEILGHDKPDILYWAGKRLARKYPMFTLEEIYEFFINAGWGKLQLIKDGKRMMAFSLTGDLIHHRLQTRTSYNFRLEAGFLAEQIQQQKKVYTECAEEIDKRNSTIHFLVKWE